jgi:hypothetical protein
MGSLSLKASASPKAPRLLCNLEVNVLYFGGRQRHRFAAVA